MLAVDVAGGVGPVVGLELSRTRRSSGGWQQALEMMARAGWCLSEKAAALRRATRSERLFSPAGVSELHCGVHHVKLAVPRDSAAASAKAYVACVLRPLA